VSVKSIVEPLDTFGPCEILINGFFRGGEQKLAVSLPSVYLCRTPRKSEWEQEMSGGYNVA
jgi:hypothetical protein